MTPPEAVQQIETLTAHVWMVRAFLKHCEEAEEDEELCEIHRALYDFMLSLGKPLKEGDAPQFLKQASKKYGKLARAAKQFREIQPEVSTHTNFQMAAASLTAAVEEIGRVLEQAKASNAAKSE